MDKKDAYREKLEAQLKEWKAKIDLLETKVSSVSADAKNELVKEIEDLRRRWNELQKTGGETWDKMKDSLEKASVELKEKLDKVLSRFK
jgi:hypothetical protein